jgi:hypothetical protein
MTAISLIIAILFIKLTPFQMEINMPAENNILNASDQFIFEDAEEDSLVIFPDIHDPSNLQIDLKLPVISFVNFKDTITTSENSISLTIALNKKIKKADIYLYVNKKKRDMYYQVGPGSYIFSDLLLTEGDNLIEFFYKTGRRRSQSVYTLILKQ